jgi:hypothetical protein
MFRGSVPVFQWNTGSQTDRHGPGAAMGPGYRPPVSSPSPTASLTRDRSLEPGTEDETEAKT